MDTGRPLDLVGATKRVLNPRAAHGGAHTSWSRACLLNLHARLLHAEGCDQYMDTLLKSLKLPDKPNDNPTFESTAKLAGAQVFWNVWPSPGSRLGLPSPIQSK
ncbi:hypothetical protein LZ32DRAFT_255824 [Colletotrichum eremochloae]|nr:hypothetical protein LZ32DRAFT_255824 [Colletotrichum eremochloae]